MNTYVTRKQELASLLPIDEPQEISEFVFSIMSNGDSGAYEFSPTSDWRIDAHTITHDGTFNFYIDEDETPFYWQEIELLIMGMCAERDGKLDDYWRVLQPTMTEGLL